MNAMDAKIAVAQFKPSPFLDKALDNNLLTHLAIMKQAGQCGVTLLVFPEMSLSGYELERADTNALTPSHVAIQTLQQQAEQLNLSIIVGAPWFNPNGKPYIASLLIRPHLPLLVYCKMHLHAGEEKYVSRGHSYLDFEHHGLHIGMAICADTTHSSHPLHYAHLQADVYVASVLITEQGYAKDSSLLQQYAKEHQLMVMMANFCGVSGGWEATGKSCIWTNDGAVLAQAEATADMCDDVNFQLLLAEQIQGVWQATSHAGTSINS